MKTINAYIISCCELFGLRDNCAFNLNWHDSLAKTNVNTESSCRSIRSFTFSRAIGIKYIKVISSGERMSQQKQNAWICFGKWPEVNRVFLQKAPSLKRMTIALHSAASTHSCVRFKCASECTCKSIVGIFVYIHLRHEIRHAVARTDSTTYRRWRSLVLPQ